MPSRPDNKTRDELLAALPEESWTPFEWGDDYVRSVTYLDIGGVMTEAWRTQYLADDLLQKANTEEYNDSETKRWGDGRVVARVPLNVLYDPKNQLIEKMREGDRDHMKWWLNNPDNTPFRTFKGKV